MKANKGDLLSTSVSPGLRRRGVSAAAINAFCRDMGITRNENVIPMHKLEHHVRAHMEATAPRALTVMRPLKVRVIRTWLVLACLFGMMWRLN